MTTFAWPSMIRSSPRSYDQLAADRVLSSVSMVFSRACWRAEWLSFAPGMEAGNDGRHSAHTLAMG